jgi:O-antigen/teichoic acid export membrane protein
VSPLVTLVAGAANIGLNLWLVPRYGAIAAAWSTLVSYAFLLVLTWWSAERLHPFPYEYRRLVLITGFALALFLAGQIPEYSNPTVEVAGRVALWLAFPVGLIATKTLDGGEVRALMALFRLSRSGTAREAGPSN